MESMAQRDHEVSLDLQGPEERRVRWEFRALKEGRDLLARKVTKDHRLVYIDLTQQVKNLKCSYQYTLSEAFNKAQVLSGL